MCGGGMQAGDDKTNEETTAENTNTNTNTGNGNNNFAGQNIDATNRPTVGQTPFSADTFASFSPSTAANFLGQSFVEGDDADTNAQANQTYDEGQQIAAQKAREQQKRQQSWVDGGGFLHGGPGSPMDPNWDNYTVGQQLNHMGTALAGTMTDLGVGIANAYRNTFGSIGTLATNAAFGPVDTIMGRKVSHWSDGFFSDPDGFMGPNDAEANTFSSPTGFTGTDNDLTGPAISTVPTIEPVKVEDIEQRFLGGLFEKGKAYLVGEQGPEVVVAGQDGQGMVVPNPATIQNNNVVPMPVKKPTPSERFLGDFSFIQNLEGTKNQGYVPTQDGKVLGTSGVTIGSGYDLGQRRNADLIGLPSDLIKKLQPYLGVKGEDALKLNYKDLNLSNDEVAIIDKFAKNDSLKNLNNLFRNETGESFYSIPKEAQTVVASVAFQYGDLSKKTPKFWKAVTNGKWNDAIAELENFGDKYNTRRNKEADLLRKVRPMEAKAESLDKLAKKYRFA